MVLRHSDPPTKGVRTWQTLFVSLALHIFALVALAALPAPKIDTLVPFEVAELEEIPAEEIVPEPEPETPPEPEPEAAPEPIQPAREIEPARPSETTRAQPTAEAPPVAEEVIEDFTGETMTAGAGAAWASETGNGQAMNGPVGNAGVRTGRRVVGNPNGAIGGTEGGTGEPALVAEANLSRRPSPPGDLNERLSRFYPRRASELSISGRITVRMQISSDGTVSRIRRPRVSDDTDAAFAADFTRACRQMLEGTRWSPPMDRNGTAVNTEIDFACVFNPDGR